MKTNQQPTGCCDHWDDPNDHAELRAQAAAAERRQTARAERLGVAWRQELAGTPDASVLVQRSAGREPEHCSRLRGADSIASLTGETAAA
jgi:hypothetical protein